MIKKGVRIKRRIQDRESKIMWRYKTIVKLIKLFFNIFRLSVDVK